MPEAASILSCRTKVGVRGIRYAFALVSGALVLLAGIACGESATQSVRGHVLEVEARSLTEVETLVVEDDTGREWRFTAEGNIGFTPSHIREHMMLGQPLTVFYEDRDGTLVAISVIN